MQANVQTDEQQEPSKDIHRAALIVLDLCIPNQKSSNGKVVFPTPQEKIPLREDLLWIQQWWHSARLPAPSMCRKNGKGFLFQR